MSTFQSNHFIWTAVSVSFLNLGQKSAILIFSSFFFKGPSVLSVILMFPADDGAVLAQQHVVTFMFMLPI